MTIARYKYGSSYKAGDDVILEIGADGNRCVRFRPTPTEDTPKVMEQLELAYLAARDEANTNQPLS